MDIESIIKLNENLIYKISTRFFNIPQEDLYQAGVIGVIKAYNNYKRNNTTKFSTYAYKYIYGEMYELSNSHRSIKLNKDILKTYKKIEQAKSLLAQKNGKIPSVQEISRYLGIEENIIYQIYLATNEIMSLDFETDRTVYETIADPKTKVEYANIIDIKDSMEELTHAEKEIINYRYFKDYTQKETADILGLSQVTVSRYEKKSLSKMYNYLSS